MINTSPELYVELLEYANQIKEFLKAVATYPTQLSFNQLNSDCYSEMYLKKQDDMLPHPVFLLELKT